MTSLASIHNPFRSSIVNDPWKSPETDVPTIHLRAFTRCYEAISVARSTHQTTAVLIHGEAGSGKTHLLARLHAHLAREAEGDGPGGLQEAIFISVRLQTSAKTLLRHLRRRFAGDLLRTSNNETSQLERLLLHQLHINGLISEHENSWLQQIRKDPHGADKLKETVEELFYKIDSEGRISYKLRQVIVLLLFRKHLAEAGAWLRGESLPKVALRKLGIDVIESDDEESGEAEDQEDEDAQIFFALCSLASSELPIVFCFDQVEALQTYPDDKAGLFAFGQMISDLHAYTQYVLIISCIQSAFLDYLQEAVRKADFARIRAFDEVALNPLTADEAFQLVNARMDSLPELKQLRAQQSNPFWPLQEEQIRTRFTPTGIVARQLLAHCAELFETHRGGKPDLPPIEEFLGKALEERRQKALKVSEPAQTDQIIAHGLPSLVHLVSDEWRQKDQKMPPGVELIFDGPKGQVAISICNSKHYPSLVKKLDKLNSQLKAHEVDKLILIRDGRMPIGRRAAKTSFLRDQLLQNGARWVEPGYEALAALDALRRLLSDAMSGDLSNHGNTVELRTVREWLAANLAVELKDLMEEVFSDESLPQPDIALHNKIAELLDKHHMVSVANAADLLSRESDEIAACVQQYPNRFGVLGEPPAVLFRVVSEVSVA